MAKEQKVEKPYECDYVRNGSMCIECLNDKNCKDTGCPVYKWRVKNA